MSISWQTHWLALGCSILTACSADSDAAGVSDWSFDRWCEGSLCDWESKDVVPAESWHKLDLAVSFLRSGSQVSQLLEGNTARCFLFDTIADVAPEARLTLQLDFNDDGTFDVEQQLAGVSWKSVLIAVPAPISYQNVRFTVVKKAEGHAVLAQLRALESECGGEPTRLRDGSTCSSDEVCEANHHCRGGQCSSLPAVARPE